MKVKDKIFNYNYTEHNDELDFKFLLKLQEEFIRDRIWEKEYYVNEIKRLNEENNNLLRKIEMDKIYIHYLLNSKWWKLTNPLRIIYRRLKNKRIRKYYQSNIKNDSEIDIIKEKISVVINTYNAGNEMSILFNNIKKQRGLFDIEVIIFDKGSIDNTLEICKKNRAKIIKLNSKSLLDDEIYKEYSNKISGKYVVYMDYKTIIDSNYWLYQAIKPIKDGNTSATIFSKNNLDVLKNNNFYYDLVDRIGKINNYNVIFFPLNRNLIQYINAEILDFADVIVKKIKN